MVSPSLLLSDYFMTDLYSTFYDDMNRAWGYDSFELYITHHKADSHVTQDVRAGILAWDVGFTPRSVRCVVITHLKDGYDQVH